MFKGRIFLLDVLRVLAATSVMVYHFSGRWGRWYATKDHPVSYFQAHPDSLFTQVATAGFMGVFVFFIISGFVIPFTALRSDYKSFAKARAIRIFKPFLPILFLTWIASFFVYGHTKFNSLEAFLTSLIITPFQTNAATSVMGSAWTLYHEVYFYSLIFLTLLIFPKQVKKYQGNFLALIGILWYALIYLSTVFNIKTGMLFDSYYAPFFITGLLLNAILEKRRWFLLPPTIFIIRQDFLIVQAKSSNETNATGLTTMISVLIILFTIFALYLATKIKVGPKLSKKINFFGLASYPIYLIQDTIGLLIFLSLSKLLSFPLSLTLSIIAVFILASGYQYFFDKPKIKKDI